MVVKDVSNLKFRIIKNEDFEKNRELVESAFDLIVRVWSVANRSLKIKEAITFDVMSNSDICGLWDGHACVALNLARVGNLKDGAFTDWDYFDIYEDDGIELIKQYGSKIDVWHKGTVDRRWGSKYTKFPMLTIVYGLMIKRLLRSDCDFAVGIVNNGLGVNQLALSWNFKSLMTKGVYNTTGDIMLVKNGIQYRNEVEEVNEIVNAIWGEYEKSIYRESRIITEQNLQPTLER